MSDSYNYHSKNGAHSGYARRKEEAHTLTGRWSLDSHCIASVSGVKVGKTRDSPPIQNKSNERNTVANLRKSGDFRDVWDPPGPGCSYRGHGYIEARAIELLRENFGFGRAGKEKYWQNHRFFSCPGKPPKYEVITWPCLKMVQDLEIVVRS